MASPTTPKTPCSMCTKPASVFTCRGCQKDYCMRHAIEHRQELGKQIDELSMNHDQFRQNLTEQMEDNAVHPFIKQINEWEQQSINKIHQTANKIRQQVETVISKHIKNLSTVLTNITHELNQARENDDYFETDLNEWMKKLNKLNEDLSRPEAVNIERSDDTISLISMPSVIISSADVIERVTGNIRIEDNGQVIVHSHGVHSHAAARGKGEYLWGQHRFHIQIERFDASKWIFLGIISKDSLMKENLHNSPSSYGWAPPNQVYLNGIKHAGYKGFRLDMEINDILELIVDCDRRKLCLTNERTGYKRDLDIDLNKCPFPWQLHFDLHYADDRIRILPT